MWRHQTGRKSLVLGMTVDYVAGMPEAESRALTAKLMTHTTRPENVYRHEWQVGDLVIWDNCGVMHRTVLQGVESIAKKYPRRHRTCHCAAT